MYEDYFWFADYARRDPDILNVEEDKDIYMCEILLKHHRRLTFADGYEARKWIKANPSTLYGYITWVKREEANEWRGWRYTQPFCKSIKIPDGLFRVVLHDLPHDIPDELLVYPVEGQPLGDRQYFNTVKEAKEFLADESHHPVFVSTLRVGTSNPMHGWYKTERVAPGLKLGSTCKNGVVTCIAFHNKEGDLPSVFKRMPKLGNMSKVDYELIFGEKTL